MEIRVLGCSGGRTPEHDLTSYLIDETMLIDTGAAAAALPLELQEVLTDVLITHSHLDHTVGVALLLENVRHSRSRPLEIYATEPTIRSIKEHLLSEAVSPYRMPAENESPIVNFHAIALEIPFWLGTYEIEAFPVNHMPGAVAYRVSDPDHTMFFTGDTGVTDRIWRWMKNRGGVDCLIAEASFPERMEELAELSSHLTPASLADSLRKAKLAPGAKVYVVHLKPSFRDEMVRELSAKDAWDLIPLGKGEVIRIEQSEGERTVKVVDIEDKVRDKMPEFDKEADLYRQRDRLIKDFGLNVNQDEYVFRQGDHSKIMYIIQEGRVKIFREAWGMKKTLSILGQGDFFGEMAMLNNRPRSASVVALENVKLLAFDRPAFENLVSSNFGVALRIIHTLAARLYESDSIIENLLYIDPPSKVINTLIQTAYDEGIETKDGYLVRTSPERLADKSGVVINTLREILSELVDDDVVELGKEAVIIPDVGKLKRLLKFLELKDEFTRE